MKIYRIFKCLISLVKVRIMNNRHIVVPLDCTGCSLCANVCGHDAITMVWNEEGFLIPQVDEDACISCGVCVKKCPALQPAPARDDKPRHAVPTYGAWNRGLEVHRASSSGGVFTALAEWTISQGGCVFGVVWKDKETAIFTKAETMEEVLPMRGSKYIMADPQGAFRSVREELRKGRRVLFVGTPCQVNALRSFLVKSYENLLTVDIVCHGVPSRVLWQKYIQETELRAGRELSHVSFRDKDEHWLRYNLTAHFVDGYKYSEFYGENVFMRLFLSDVALNRCCYCCRYAGVPRQGDLTLGDFWGVQNYHPDWPLREGIGALLVNTPAGDAALKAVRSTVECREVPFSEVYAGQDLLHDKGKGRTHPNRSALMSSMAKLNLPELRDRYVGTVLIGPWAVSRTSLMGKLFLKACKLLQKLNRRAGGIL